MAKLEVDRRGAAMVVTLNRPEVHNAVDGETALALNAAVRDFADDGDARVLVVTGAGGAAFCSGADLRRTGELRTHDAYGSAGPMGFAMLDPGKPTIAAVEGYCFAGGMELAAWCDVRIAAEHAEFGVLNRRWGVPLVDGGTQRLARIVGLGNALYLVETGVRIDAARAAALGFVQEVVPRGAALPRALELAGRIAGYPQASLRHDRAATLAGLGMPLREGLRMEHDTGEEVLVDPELLAALEGYARGDRPEAPRPPG